MASSIAALAAQFAKTDKRDNEEFSGNNYYPFWNMKTGERAVLRFLPDANTENPLAFLVEKHTHTLQIGDKRHTIPCLKMYGDECPICALSKKFYDAKDEVNGKKYWRKKQHIAQALIMEDPLPADKETGKTHVGEVRNISISFQLFNIIKEAFASGELDEVPYAYKGGTDFIIKKTEQGGYASYTAGSTFSRKSTDLDDEIVASLELADLSTLIPQKPDIERVNNLLQQALTGGTEDSDGDVPTVVKETHTSDDVPAPRPAAKVVKDEKPAAAPEASNATAAAILAKIRARTAQ